MGPLVTKMANSWAFFAISIAVATATAFASLHSHNHTEIDEGVNCVSDHKIACPAPSFP